MGNPFIGLPVGTLSSLQSAYIDCLTALASNQSYSLNGRSLTRVNLNDVQTALGNINAALAMAQGNTSAATYVSFTGS
jgi:hypothetical protein